LVLLAACRADVAVGIDVHGDGGGVVRVTATLDKEAADRVGSGSGDIAVADLRRAGWTIDGPRALANGSTVISATKPFTSPDQLPAVVAELAGTGGPFKDFVVTRDRSLFTTTTRFHGVVELRPCLADFADDDLRKQLGGPGAQCLGLDPAAVKDNTGVDPDQVVHFTVSARLPGGETVSRPLSPGAPVGLAAQSRRYNTGTIVWLVVAGVAALAVAALLLKRLMYRRDRPR
jgi:hypothetical protein